MSERETMNDFRRKLYYYEAVVREPFDRYVHDGDTFTVELDFGIDRVDRRFEVRPIGFNAPELKTHTRVAGEASRIWLITLFESIKDSHGKPYIYLETILNPDLEERQSGKRYLCKTWVPGPDGSLHDLAQLMVAAGYAVKS